MKEFKKPLVVLLIGAVTLAWAVGIAAGTMIFWNSCITKLFNAAEMNDVGFITVSWIALLIGCIIMRKLFSAGKERRK